MVELILDPMEAEDKVDSWRCYTESAVVTDAPTLIVVRIFVGDCSAFGDQCLARVTDAIKEALESLVP